MRFDQEEDRSVSSACIVDSSPKMCMLNYIVRENRPSPEEENLCHRMSGLTGNQNSLTEAAMTLYKISPGPRLEQIATLHC